MERANGGTGMWGYVIKEQKKHFPTDLCEFK